MNIDSAPAGWVVQEAKRLGCQERGGCEFFECFHGNMPPHSQLHNLKFGLDKTHETAVSNIFDAVESE